MADHYQYTAERGTAQIGGAYQGSWQESVRDIDPSNVILAHAEPDDEGSMSALHAFWATAQLPDWHPETAPEPWAQITVDVPRPVDLLFRRDEPSLSDWVVLATDLKWTAPKSAYETALA
ncbi:hypothetical protein GR268_48680, partial [Rhizobium leguminosarum]|nr:hypothetical protein [Rhizobium leguminosarum]